MTSPPAVVDGVVYAKAGGTLYAVNADEGTERWRFDGGSPDYSTPAVVGGVVFVGCMLFGEEKGTLEPSLLAVNADDGTEMWRFAVSTSIQLTPAVMDGIVYFGDNGGTFLAVNTEDGNERWRFEAGGGPSTPAVVDGVVYVRGSGLVALDATDGTERWRFEAGGRSSSPAVVDGVVYFGSESKNLYAVDAVHGTERWQIAIGDDGHASPVVVGGRVYIGSYDLTNGENSGSVLYAIGAIVPKLSVGGTARVTEMTTLRGGPARTAVERAELNEDTVVTITGESETNGDVVWWPVTVNETGDQGWVEASKLEPLTSSQAGPSTENNSLTSDQLAELLPSANIMPEGLTESSDTNRSLAQVIEALGGSRTAETNLDAWGWSGNVERQFAAPEDAPVDDAATGNIVVSIHGFGSPKGAAEALIFFSDIHINASEYVERENPNVGDSARLLTMTDQEGQTYVAHYVQDGSVMYRIGGYSAAGDPAQDVINVATAMLGG
jgi:outer membrane protein assembly factor BamB